MKARTYMERNEMAKVKFTAAEVAEKTGLAPNTITTYCKRGKVPGAYMEGKRWVLTPESLQVLETVKPRADHSRIGKRLQLVLDEPEPAGTESQAPAEEAFSEETKAATEALVKILSAATTTAQDAEETDPVSTALVETAWRLIGEAAELLIKAGYHAKNGGSFQA